MASGWTNKGKAHAVGVTFRGETPPTNYYLALVTSATSPDADSNLMSDFTEIAAGNGYTAGGYSLSRNSTDFDTWTEDDTADEGLVKIKNVVWTASGGTIPGSGDGARWALLTDDDGTVANREVYAYFDLGSVWTASDAQTFTLSDFELTLS